MTKNSATAEKGYPFDKVPPQNLEAEESLISAILLDNNTLLDILDILAPLDFYKTAHQIIFEAVTELFNRGDPIDLVTLADHIKSKNQLEAIGGAVYLARLVDTAPVPANAKHYALIIRDKAALRRLITAAGRITTQCFEYSANVDEVIDDAEKTIFEISENKSRQSIFPISQIIESNIDTLESRRGNKSILSGVPTGYRKLDKLTSGFQKSDLIILAARPGMGKTALALNFARNTAVAADTPVAFFSLEMSKEQLSMRLLCAEARLDSARLRDGFFTEDEWIKLINAADTLSSAPIYIDDSPELSPLEIKTKARRLKREKQIGLILIDYLQLMRSRSGIERRELEISEMSRSLKGLAKELDIPIVALSQLNRRLEERQDKRPQLADLRESGALEQDADLVIFIYRDEIYNKEESNPNKGIAEVHLAKQRNGPVGVAYMAFLDAYTRFEDLAYDDGFSG
jgi:replicative DNA helicase